MSWMEVTTDYEPRGAYPKIDAIHLAAIEHGWQWADIHQFYLRGEHVFGQNQSMCRFLVSVDGEFGEFPVS